MATIFADTHVIVWLATNDPRLQKSLAFIFLIEQ